MSLANHLGLDRDPVAPVVATTMSQFAMISFRFEALPPLASVTLDSFRIEVCTIDRVTGDAHEHLGNGIPGCTQTNLPDDSFRKITLELTPGDWSGPRW